MPKYRSTFNHIYHLLVLVMRTSTKNALAAMFIITSSVSLIQSGLFSSFSQHSSTFPITNDVYASKKKDTNTYDSPSAIPDKKGVLTYDYGGKTGKVYNPLIVSQGGDKSTTKVT